MSTYTGEYFEYMGEATMRVPYYSFTPKALIKNTFYSVDEELLLLLAEAHRKLGFLEGLYLYMPNQTALKDIFQKKESFFSYKIDYPTESLFFYADSDAQRISNIICSYNELLGSEIALGTLEKTYSISKHGIGAEQLSIRKKPMFLSDVVPAIKQYAPTAPDHIKSALRDMVQYLGIEDYDVLIKTAMSHYQFEMIHPFDSYNGIVGRILAAHTLSRKYPNAVNLLSISEFLYRQQNEYFDLLALTQKRGGYLRWIRFFVEIITKSATQSSNQIEEYQKIISDDIKFVLSSNLKSNSSTFAVLDYWKSCLMSDIKSASDSLRLSFNTVERAIQRLGRLGIIKQYSFGHRNRQFGYSRLIELFIGGRLD